MLTRSLRSTQECRIIIHCSNLKIKKCSGLWDLAWNLRTSHSLFLGGHVHTQPCLVLWLLSSSLDWEHSPGRECVLSSVFQNLYRSPWPWAHAHPVCAEYVAGLAKVSPLFHWQPKWRKPTWNTSRKNPELQLCTCPRTISWASWKGQALGEGSENPSAEGRPKAGALFPWTLGLSEAGRNEKMTSQIINKLYHSGVSKERSEGKSSNPGFQTQLP